MMKKTLSIRSKKIVTIICALAIVFCGHLVFNNTNTVFAAEMSDGAIKDYSDTGIMPYGEYHTFYKFQAGTYTGGFGFDFSTDKSCVLRFMYVAGYTNGQSGSITYILQRKNGFPGVYIEGTSGVDGSGHIVILKDTKLPAGNYNLMIIPNDVSTSIIFNGEVYTLDYW